MLAVPGLLVQGDRDVSRRGESSLWTKRATRLEGIETPIRVSGATLKEKKEKEMEIFLLFCILWTLIGIGLFGGRR